MTRKRYIKLTRALFDRVQVEYNGKHPDGDMIRFITSRGISEFKTINSYQEAWDKFYAIRVVTDFKERGKMYDKKS